MVTLVVLVIVGFSLAGLLISAYYLLHQLFRHEYQFHREEWEKDGRPGERGLQPSFRSDFAYMRCSLVWLFHTPRWVRDDVTAKRLLSRLRWCVLSWNVGLIVFLPFVVWYIRSTYHI
jgi:hypothetical protein